jgi:tight adherence protein B
VETIGQNLAAELALQAKADALTSQGRLQAIVMIGIPPALLLMTGVMDGGVWGFFFETTLGTSLLWGVFALEVIGLLWIRKITRVRRSQ